MSTESAVEFPTPTRIHVALAVRDIARSADFYRALLGQEPTKVRPGYAKFEVIDPPLNLALNETPVAVTPPLPQHFGIQAKQHATIGEIEDRLTGAGFIGEPEEQVTCCYAVQEVFVRVLERLDQLRDDERLAGWIRRITANVVADHYRGRPDAEALPPELAAPDLGTEDDDRERALLASWVAATVATLEAQHREVLTLTELGGLTQREAAARLGLSLPAVKARVRRGRIALLERLERCCHVELDHQGTLVGYTPRSPCTPAECCPPTDES